MANLQFEHYEDDEINIILRDLSESENLNVKELFEERTAEEEGSRLSSSALKFIEKNKARSNAKAIDRDNQRLRYFKDLSSFRRSLFDEIPNFETENGKKKFKLKLLRLAYEEKLEKHMINLYLQVLDDQYDKEDSKTMRRVGRVMDKIDYKRMQFEKLSNELHPLDFYNEHPKTLDEWQLRVIRFINNNESVIVSAPTSCGKTWLAIYPGVIGKSLLFLVPTDALVFQVGALLNKYTSSQPILMTNEAVYGSNPKIIVGTPKKVEDLLPVVGTDFDYVVYDEIHNLNDPDIGEYYERLLEVFSDKPTLALSATIGDPNSLVNWMSQFHEREINLVTYSTRFLNLQRKIFQNNKLINIHPMACLTLDDINHSYLSGNLPMTPPDCVQLFESLKEIFPDEMKDLKVKTYFPQDNRRLSLDDSRQYESSLKNKLIQLKETNPEEIQQIINKYNVETEMGDINLYNLFKEIKTKNLIPCIVFQINTGYCREIFVKLVGYLEKLETLNYPYHYENLEFRLEHYKKAEEEVKKFKENIKVDRDVYNAREYIEDKVEKKRAELLNTFTDLFQKKIQRQLHSITKNTNINDRVKRTQISNLKSEYMKYMKCPTLGYVDVYQKHEDFCLNSDSPMSADKIREIKRTIKSKMGIDVSYTNVFMQGLKRGLGIYTKHMPPVYNMIVQRYAQNGELGFVVADDRLALGINMPFRSTCILGYKDSIEFENHKYMQMIGRSGRRGKDAEGHIIFANVDWKNLMKSELSTIVSDYKFIKNYRVISEFTDKFDDKLDNIFNFPMNIEDQDNNFSEESNKEFFKYSNLNKVLWKLREYNNKAIDLCRGLMEFDMNMRVEKNHHSIVKTINFVSDKLFDENHKLVLLEILRNKKLRETDYTEFIIIKEFLRVLIEIHNSLINSSNSEDYSYQFAVEHLKHTFNVMKKIVLNSNDLN
tara:strand:+ start:525 stop:3341 length:2817 start_codon:yes stop_codon:yes gene_type:complete